jgi:hypothetical protein
MNATPVEAVTTMTASLFYEHVETNRPVLMRGLLAPALAASNCDGAGLRDRMGDRRVPVEVALDGRFFGGMQSEDGDVKRIVDMRCDEFIRRLDGDSALPRILGPGEKYYARSTPLAEYGPLDAEIPVPEVLDDPRYGTVERQIFISGRGHTTPAHTDCWVDNALAQIVGTKHVLMWSPDQVDELAIRPFGTVHSRQSALDPLAPDLDRFPAYAFARALKASLVPGDVLYIPQGWVHHITTDQLSISVSHKFNHQRAFEEALVGVASYLAGVRPELRDQYLHLLRWPASMLAERIN